MTFVKCISIGVCAAALLVSVGCGGGGGSTPATVAELPPTLAASICDKFTECAGPAAAIFLPGDCTDMFAAQLADQQVPLWQAAIDAGTLTYAPSRVSACRDALAAADCSVISGGFPAACDEVFTGTVPSAGACHINEECAGDAYCNTDAACPGTCAPRVAAGGSCSQDDACQGDLTCDGATCVVPSAVGAACGGPSAPGCSDLMNCVGATDTASGTCQPLRTAFTVARGDACDPDAGMLCVVGSVCGLTGFDIASGSVMWTCEAPVSADAACHLGFPDPCPESQYCDADPETTMSFDGTCVDLPAAGAACITGPTADLGKSCAPGSVCDGEICGTLGRLGGACTGDQGCASDHCTDRVCAAPACQ